MSLVKLSLATVGDLDGGAAGLVIDKAFYTAAKDLEDRGKDKKPRKVLIEVSMQQMEGGQVIIGVDAEVKAPKFRTAETIGCYRLVDGKPVVAFQDLNPESPQQPTYPEFDDAVKNRPPRESE